MAKRIGCIDCRLLEPAPGSWVEGRCPICRLARGLSSKSRGRPKTCVRLNGKCERCGEKFEYWFSSKDSVRRFCGVRCHLKSQHVMRAKLPDAGTLRELYLKRNLSTPKIGEMYGADARSVNAALRKAGITIRRKTKTITCTVEGCSNPVKKIRHSNNGALYGTLCARHRYEHRLEMARDYARKVRNIPPEKWKGSRFK